MIENAQSLGHSTQPDQRPLLVQGDAVGLAMMRKEDIPAVTRWNQDLEFTALLGTPGEIHSLEMREKFFNQNASPRGDSIEFAVLLVAGRRLIGFGGLSDITRALTATLFVGIGEPDCRNKGYGTEATRLICEYGFFFRSLHSIKVEVNSYNQAAIRLYERLGFKRAGRLRGTIFFNGQRFDQVILDLLRDELELRHIGRFRRMT
jgi:RimJ/RimL family protein N-acetyltransferase